MHVIAKLAAVGGYGQILTPHPILCRSVSVFTPTAPQLSQPLARRRRHDTVIPSLLLMRWP